MFSKSASFLQWTNRARCMSRLRDEPVPALPMMKTECRTSKISFSWTTLRTKLFCAVGLASSACRCNCMAASLTLLSNVWSLCKPTDVSPRSSSWSVVTSCVPRPKQEINHRSDWERSAYLRQWSLECWNRAVLAWELCLRSYLYQHVAMFQQRPRQIWSPVDPNRSVPNWMRTSAIECEGEGWRNEPVSITNRDTNCTEWRTSDSTAVHRWIPPRRDSIQLSNENPFVRHLIRRSDANQSIRNRGRPWHTV